MLAMFSQLPILTECHAVVIYRTEAVLRVLSRRCIKCIKGCAVERYNHMLMVIKGKDLISSLGM